MGINVDYKGLVNGLIAAGVKFPTNKRPLAQVLINLKICSCKRVAYRLIAQMVQAGVLFGDMTFYNFRVDNIQLREPEPFINDSKEGKIKEILKGGMLRSADLKRIAVHQGLFTTERGAEIFIKRCLKRGVLIKESYKRYDFRVSYYDADIPIPIKQIDVDDLIVRLCKSKIRTKDLKDQVQIKCGICYRQADKYVIAALRRGLIVKVIQKAKRNFFVIEGGKNENGRI